MFWTTVNLDDMKNYDSNIERTKLQRFTSIINLKDKPIAEYFQYYNHRRYKLKFIKMVHTYIQAIPMFSS